MQLTQFKSFRGLLFISLSVYLSRVDATTMGITGQDEIKLNRSNAPCRRRIKSCIGGRGRRMWIFNRVALKKWNLISLWTLFFMSIIQFGRIGKLWIWRNWSMTRINKLWQIANSYGIRMQFQRMKEFTTYTYMSRSRASGRTEDREKLSSVPVLLTSATRLYHWNVVRRLLLHDPF